MSEKQYSKEFDQMIPHLFVVEPVLGCDLKCPECAVGGNRITKKKGWMRFDQFKIIADKIRPFCKYLYLHHNGEPMLNKDIFKMIEYASVFTATNVSTNGQCLTEEKCENLIKSGVTEIIVSIDGMSQDVYGKYRVGGSVEKALWALKTLQEFNVKHGNKTRIMPQFCVFKHNRHEMNPFYQYCHSIGLRPFFKTPFVRHGSLFETIPGYMRPAYPNTAAARQAMAKECQTPKTAFTILLDGTCVLCCADNNGITAYGNIYEQDVLEIWNSLKYKNDRWGILTGDAPNFCIENCLSWAVGGRVYERENLSTMEDQN